MLGMTLRTLARNDATQLQNRGALATGSASNSKHLRRDKYDWLISQ
jgi:hypothetical protein